MEAQFQIRPKSETESYIQLYVTDKGKRFRFQTPYTILKTQWAKGRPKKTANVNLKRNLDRLRTKINDFIEDSIKNKERKPSQNELQTKIAEVLGRTKQADFRGVYAQYLQLKKEKVSEPTIQQIETSFQLLFDFNSKIQFQDFDALTGAKFTSYLSKKGFMAVTVNKHHKNLKAFFNWCYAKDFTKTNLSKYLINLETKADQKTIIAVTEQERVVLENAELDTRLDKIRNLFLMGCYTGLRFGDVIRVSESMIYANEINIVQQKTKAPIQIPLLTGAKKILQKYDGVMPAISNQKANAYLKELFKFLKLNRLVLDNKQKKMVPLSEAVTFHVSRKSFITIALSNGMNAKIVQAISGHKKDSVFNQYINFSSETRNTEMQKMEPKPAPSEN